MSMTNKNIVFDIIVPVFNTKKELLNRSISSVLKQSYDKFKLIIINDGSFFNETNEFLNSLNDNRIIIKNISNSGPSKARNEGLSLVNGDYFLFLDSDDYLCTDALESLKNFILSKKFPDIVLFGFFDCGYDYSKKMSNLDESYLSQVHLLNPNKNILDVWLLNTIWNKCYSIKFKKFRFNENIKQGEDRIYLLQIFSSENFPRICVLAKGIYYYSYTFNSLSKTIDFGAINNIFAYLKIIIECIKGNDKIGYCYANTLVFDLVKIYDYCLFYNNYSLLTDNDKKEIIQFIFKYVDSDELDKNFKLKIFLLKNNFFSIYKLIFYYIKRILKGKRK